MLPYLTGKSLTVKQRQNHKIAKWNFSSHKLAKWNALNKDNNRIAKWNISNQKVEKWYALNHKEVNWSYQILHPQQETNSKETKAMKLTES